MDQTILKLLICAALAPMLSAAGQSSLDTWTFEGTLTKGLPGSPYLSGLRYSASFDIDKARLQNNASGLYFPTLGYGFQIACCGVSSSSTGSGVLIANDLPDPAQGSFDGILFGVNAEPSTGFPGEHSFDGSAWGITLVNHSAESSAGPFTEASFPARLELGSFETRILNFRFQQGTVVGSVDTLRLNGILMSQVPEPATTALLALGSLLFWSWRIISRSATNQKAVQPGVQ